MDNQNTQSAGDSAKQIGQIGQAESIDFGSITIEKDAISSAIISGNGNRVVIYQYQVERQVEEYQSARVGEIGPNPYKGLLAFQETDGSRFFGREKQIEQLWDKFRSLHEGDSTIRLLPIYGPSGSGKSSLARAGLIPEFARRPLPGYVQARVAVLVPGTHPLEALASVLARVANNDPTPVAKTREFAGELEQANKEGEYDGLRRIADVLPDIAISPLIVLVDQFEEVYSLCENLAERDAFIGNLLTGGSSRSRHVSVIVTLRSDFLGETQKHPVLNRLFAQQGFLVPTMDEEELRQAIRQPAELAGHPLDNATIELLIKDTEGREGSLPLLQFALTHIWEGLAEGKEPAETLKAIGGVGGALAGEAQRIYDSLSTEEQDIARRVFRGLVQLGEGTKDTRRRTEIKNLVSHWDSPEQVKQVIARFSAPGARLITLAANANADTAEVTHETLFDHWQQLKNWLDSSRSDIRYMRRLNEAALYWDENKRLDGDLWRPPALDVLRRFHQRACDNMTRLQIEFFNASLEAENARKQAAEKVKKERTRLRQVVVFSLIIGLTIALWQGSVARQERQNAFASSLLDRAQLLSQPNLLSIKIALSLDAIEHSESVELKPFLYDDLALLSSSIPLDDKRGSVNAVAISKSGKYIATAGLANKTGSDGYACVWEAPNYEKPHCMGSKVKSVNAVAFDPQEKHWAAASLDGKTCMWDINSDKLIYCIPHKKKDSLEVSANVVSFSLDGKYIATAWADGQVDVLETSSYKNTLCCDIPRTLPDKASIIAIAFSPDSKFLAAANLEGKVYVWDLTNRQKKVLEGHTQAVNAVAFNPTDSNYLATASSDKNVYVWNLKSSEKPLLSMKHKGGVVDVTFSEDGKSLATASLDESAYVWLDWNSPSIKKKEPLKLRHQGPMTDVDFSKDGKYLATASSDNIARVWDVTSGYEFARLNHKDGVNAIAFSPDRKSLVTASLDGTARVWEINGKSVALMRHKEPVTAMVLSNDGKHIATASNDKDKSLRVWSATSGYLEALSCIQKNNAQETVTALIFNKDGKYLATVNSSHQFKVWELDDNKHCWKPLGEKPSGENVNSVVFSPHDNYLATTSFLDSSVQLWSIRNGKLDPPHKLTKHKQPVTSVTFSKEGKYLATASNDKTACWWEVKAETQSGCVQHDAFVEAVAFSPDSEYLATASRDGQVIVWNREKTGRDNQSGYVCSTSSEPNSTCVHLPQQNGPVTSVVFNNPNKQPGTGSYLVTVSGDNIAKVWKITEKSKQPPEPATNLKHDGAVTAATFSPNNEYLATASKDRNIRVWKTTSGEMLEKILHGGALTAVAFLDGERLATMSEDHTVRVFLWNRKKLKEEACKHLTSNLTQKEWRQYINDKNNYQKTCQGLP